VLNSGLLAVVDAVADLDLIHGAAVERLNDAVEKEEREGERVEQGSSSSRY